MFYQHNTVKEREKERFTCFRIRLVFIRSGNAIGPEGAKTLAVPLEQLTALQRLDLRCSEGWRTWRGQSPACAHREEERAPARVGGGGGRGAGVG